jgi:nicotinamide phosphoribosyltransferase
LNNVRVIWGDGINLQSIQAILRIMVDLNGWSADNFAFGMGGSLLQIIDRDTQKFALKCSSVRVNGVDVDVQKDPITDQGKKSKAGRVTLWTNSGGEFVSAVNQPTGWTDKGIGGWTNALVEVFRDGKLITETSFQEVRDRANKG